MTTTKKTTGWVVVKLVWDDEGACGYNAVQVGTKVYGAHFEAKIAAKDLGNKDPNGIYQVDAWVDELE